MEPNLLSVTTLASTPQRINRNHIESLLDTTNIPNLDQAAPDLGILLPLGLLSLTI